MHDTREPREELAVLVGLERSTQDKWATEDSILELRELTHSAGAKVIAEVIQKKTTPAASTFIGKGKAQELAVLCKEEAVDTVVFDDDLTPAQGRNLSKILGEKVKVIDRTELILDIFAQRARTREGKIQVELAQLQYMLPRLTGLWTHLSRQRGGVGTRGPGEQQLEVDRRRIMEKISRLRRDLGEVRKNRRIERSGRQKLHWPLISLVGYTNSGKSTLMNALTHANVLAADKLFATLDPTTRKLRLPNNQNILLSDTVGFLRKLPHHLIESFQATLEEVAEADFLLHIVDVSHPQATEQISAVQDVLVKINAADKPTIVVLNKEDRLEADAPILDKFLREYEHAVSISAKHGTHLDDLLEEVMNRIHNRRTHVVLSIPNDRAKTIAMIYRCGHVIGRESDDEHVILTAQIPRVLSDELSPFIVKSSTNPKIQ